MALAASGGTMADIGAMDYAEFAAQQAKQIEAERQKAEALQRQELAAATMPLGGAADAYRAFGREQAMQAGQAAQGVLASGQGVGGMQAAALGGLVAGQAQQSGFQAAAEQQRAADMRQLQYQQQLAQIGRQQQLGQLGLAREQIATSLGSERALDDLRQGLAIEREKAEQAAGERILGGATSAAGSLFAGYEKKKKNDATGGATG